MNYKAFREMYEDKKRRLEYRMVACFLCMLIWVFFGSAYGTIGNIIVLLILLLLTIFYGCGISKMDLNLKQLKSAEAMSILKCRY